jgi:DNA-3-methyladenine glycosylase
VGEIKKLDASFYNRGNVLRVARELLGKILVTRLDNRYTSGRIVETEAYRGVTDRASHAYGGRRTDRTEVMYRDAGRAYVYFVYGMHHLFNVVTAGKDIPHAILIRALEPLEGIETMAGRTGKRQLDFALTSGPGNLSKALGLTRAFTGTSLLGDEIFIADDGFVLKKNMIASTVRIGVDYAGQDASLKYRFIIRGNKYVSGGKKYAG